MQLVQVSTQTQLEDFCRVPGSYPLNLALPSIQQADAHWLVLGADGQGLARGSL
jgi:hypothetical protein